MPLARSASAKIPRVVSRAFQRLCTQGGGKIFARVLVRRIRCYTQALTLEKSPKTNTGVAGGAVDDEITMIENDINDRPPRQQRWKMLGLIGSGAYG
jgi:hypothetical protein